MWSRTICQTSQISTRHFSLWFIFMHKAAHSATIRGAKWLIATKRRQKNRQIWSFIEHIDFDTVHADAAGYYVQRDFWGGVTKADKLFIKMSTSGRCTSSILEVAVSGLIEILSGRNNWKDGFSILDLGAFWSRGTLWCFNLDSPLKPDSMSKYRTKSPR